MESFNPIKFSLCRNVRTSQGNQPNVQTLRSCFFAHIPPFFRKFAPINKLNHFNR